MKHEIKLIREIEDLCDDVPNQKLEITIDGSATLDEMLDQFEYFLKAAGYYIPDKQRLEFVDEE
jgi:hypothetical protein